MKNILMLIIIAVFSIACTDVTYPTVEEEMVKLSKLESPIFERDTIIFKDTIKLHTLVCDTVVDTLYSNISIIDTEHVNMPDTMYYEIQITDTIKDTIVDMAYLQNYIEDDVKNLGESTEIPDIKVRLGKNGNICYSNSYSGENEIIMTFEVPYDNTIRIFTIRKIIGEFTQCEQLTRLSDINPNCITIKEIHIIDPYTNIERDWFYGEKNICVN